MKGARHFLRNYTAMAVKEHLRSAVEGSGGTPELTENELALLRFVLVGEFDWGAVIAARPSS